MRLLPVLIDAAVVVFSVSSMLSVGLGNPARELVQRLRATSRVVRAVAANFVLVPLLAVAVTRLMPLAPPLATGLLLVATAAGAPFLIKLTEVAEGEMGSSTALLVVLLPVTVLTMPIVVPLLVSGTTVSAGAIAVPLLVTMLLPLAVGMVLREWRPTWEQMLRPVSTKTSTVALLLLVAATVLANSTAITDLVVQGALLPALLVIGGAFGIGYLLGGSDARFREVLGLGTSQRNIAAATVVATQSFADPRIVVMVVVTSLVGFAVLFPVAALFRKRRS